MDMNECMGQKCPFVSQPISNQHQLVTEELLNQVSVEIIRDRTAQLFLSKIDLDYAYGQSYPTKPADNANSH